LLMAPFVLVEFGAKTLRRPRCNFFVAHVAPGTWHARAAAGAGVLAFPGSTRVSFANPAAVLTD
jgi:hypothetical protein